MSTLAKPMNNPLGTGNFLKYVVDLVYNGFGAAKAENAFKTQNEFYQRLAHVYGNSNSKVSYPHDQVPLVDRLNLVRKLIVLPLKQREHNKYDMNYQYLNADKCILPISLQKYLVNSKIGMSAVILIEVCIMYCDTDAPWVFRIGRDVSPVKPSRPAPAAMVSSAYTSTGSFHPHEAYIFVPEYLMGYLSLSPGKSSTGASDLSNLYCL